MRLQLVTSNRVLRDVRVLLGGSAEPSSVLLEQLGFPIGEEHFLACVLCSFRAVWSRSVIRIRTS